MTSIRTHLATAGWHTENGISVKGSAYLNGSLLDAKELCLATQTISEEIQFASFLRNLNGFFAIIIKNNGRVFAATDIIRSIPLFYSIHDNAVHLSDKAESIQKITNTQEADDVIRHEFMLTGFVTGSDTLVPGIKQLQSGEYFTFFDKREWKTDRYFTFTHEARYGDDKVTLWNELDQTYLAAVERLAQWAGGRPIIVPLSGGYDSRLLAALLKQINYKTVITFTYGRSTSAEIELAQEVAKRLGFQCTMVEYSNEDWWRWFHSSQREAYFRAAHNLVSVPQIQDWPAVWTLKKDNLVPPDAVMAPGYTANFVAGEHIPKKFCELDNIKGDDFVTQILDQHYTLWQPPRSGTNSLNPLKERIMSVSGFRALDGGSFDYATRKYEAWEWQERQAKFIVNSVQVNEFWGYEWWLPYLDKEVASYWLKVPYQWRIGGRLYREYAVDKFARIANLSLREASRRAPNPRIKRLGGATAAYLMARNLFRLIATKKLQRRKRASLSYDRHPLAIYGMMDRDTFDKYRHKFRNFHSFISKAILEGDYF